MLIRIRSREGNFRFELSPATDISEFVLKILQVSPGADPSTLTISNQPRGNEVKAATLTGRNLQSLGFKHGDLIFVNYQIASTTSTSTSSIVPSQTTVNAKPASSIDTERRPWELAKEDQVDTYWRSKDGKIPRGRDSRFCKHGANGMCDYCMPLEPYDATYHKEHSIKHLSYHAYLQKLTPKSNSATALLPPLNPLSYKVKVPCPTGSHPPWPAGICSSCQPSAITLQPQPFRMVDHIEIAGTDIIDHFLQAWRKTGLQRFGWLIGHYQPYDEVPMGVKAVVEAIHEPTQQGELDGLILGLPWEDEPRIRELAKNAGTPLSIVGYIFTDLDPTSDDRTKNVYKRHPGSYFLTSLETIFAAKMQQANPTASRSSPTGQFSSRLVTTVLTATEDGHVDISAYQVSEQAVAMVEADMIEASVDPGIVRVKEEESSRYVPDVFFRYKNEYGLEVKKSAKPSFPVEYLIVNVTHGFPQTPDPLFKSNSFGIENRPGLESQNVEDLMRVLVRMDAPNIHVSQQGDDGDTQKRLELAKVLSDWHLITFLGTTQLFSENDMNEFVRCVASPTFLKDPSRLNQVLVLEGWQTLMTFARESGTSTATASASKDDEIPQSVFDQIAAEEEHTRAVAAAEVDDAPLPVASNIRTCPHCTFENTHGGSDCELCGLPLG